MQEFTDEIPRALQRDDAKVVDDILAGLRGFGFRNADIEGVIDVLSAREDPNRAKRSIGPRLVEFSERITNRTPDGNASALLGKIKEQIELRCSQARFQQSDTYYQKFFRQAPSAKMNGIVPTIYQQIFTTNYDRCIDRFLRNYGYTDGFEAKAGYGIVFEGTWAATNERPFTLCKLHGSVNWFEVGGRVTQHDFAPGQSFTGEQVTGRMMVYPASEKYALTTPYAECLFFLRQSLIYEKVYEPVVVVGYSFRDEPINNAFADAIKLNPNLKILSLSRRASAHQYDLEEPLRSTVVPVDAEFGTDYAIEAVSRAYREN